jgi:tRNA(fMet)-specific endonuclease VapC
MIILDSDHLSVLRFQSARADRLKERLDQSSIPTIATSIVNVEEAMRGWLAAIAKERQIERQFLAYRELGEMFAFFSGFTIASLDSKSIQLFKDFRTSGVRIGTMDLKTACIAIANNALLLTANRRDFEKVPGLKFENWLDP